MMLVLDDIALWNSVVLLSAPPLGAVHLGLPDQCGSHGGQRGVLRQGQPRARPHRPLLLGGSPGAGAGLQTSPL